MQADQPNTDNLQSHHLKAVSDLVVHFGSNSKPPFCMLSNFSKIQIMIHEKNYPSLEHAFQANRIEPNHESADEYICAGPICELSESAFTYVGVNANKAAKKVKYWSKKNMHGILAKMLIKKHEKKGLKRSMTSQQCKDLLLQLLRQKYANIEMREVLLKTGTQYLLEFEKSAERRFKQGDIARWGGMLVNGRIIGHNQMGILLMQIREEIFEEIPLSMHVLYKKHLS